MKQLIWIAMIAATSAAQQTVQPPAQPDGDLDEITVTAPEPRYVAPTTRDRIGRIWAPVYLDGKGPFRLVLDTGANHSAVIERVAVELGDQARSNSTARLHGATGTAVVPTIRVDELVVGDLTQERVKLPVVLDVFGGAEGVLGNDGLHDKRIVIDFKHDSISIKRSRRERPGEGFRTIPITFARDYLPIIDAHVGQIPVKAIIDTGAPDSLGNMALLNALKQRVGDSPTMDIVGVTLDIEHGYRVRMPPIYLQAIEVRGAALNFGDVYIFQHWRMTNEPSMMLGMDVLGVMDEIIIDYRTRELHIRSGHVRTGTVLFN
jgi:predicted aspartyl protease